MTEERIEPGDSRWLTTTVHARHGEVGDPTTLTFTMNEPDGTITQWTWPYDPEITRDTLGVFSVDWLVTQVGTHKYGWQSKGNNATVKDDYFIAKARRVSMPAAP